jgi:hypothetical protein
MVIHYFENKNTRLDGIWIPEELGETFEGVLLDFRGIKCFAFKTYDGKIIGVRKYKKLLEQWYKLEDGYVRLVFEGRKKLKRGKPIYLIKVER